MGFSTGIGITFYKKQEDLTPEEKQILDIVNESVQESCNLFSADLSGEIWIPSTCTIKPGNATMTLYGNTVVVPLSADLYNVPGFDGPYTMHTCIYAAPETMTLKRMSMKENEFAFEDGSFLDPQNSRLSYLHIGYRSDSYKSVQALAETFRQNVTDHVQEKAFKAYLQNQGERLFGD